LHGFSRKFYNEIIEPLYSVLFITKQGLLQQSTAQSLAYLGTTDLGYTQFDSTVCEREPKVFRTHRGSTNFWHQVADEIGLSRIHLNTPVTKIKRKRDDKWDVTLGGSGGGTTRQYDQVVFSPDASIALEIIDGIPWLTRLVLGQLEWSRSYLSLHNNTAFIEGHPGSTTYHYQDRPAAYTPTLSGWMGKEFGYENSKLIVTLHFEEEFADDVIGRENILETNHWTHPITTMWHSISTFWWLMAVNHRRNLHFVGGYANGLGHIAAIRTGVRAACKIGVHNAPENRASVIVRDSCEFS